MLPSTVDRVPEHTSREVNRDITERTRRSLRFHARNPELIGRRLRQLDREWDIERVLETNASLAVLTGLGLGATVDRRWYAFSGVVAGFLLQHALQGWCPPLPVFRRLGFRTQAEIERERYALKSLRARSAAAAAL